MKSHLFIILTVWIGAWLLSACSSLDGQCIVRGKFTNFSDGELYFYMPDGPREKLDTVTVRDGKFNYAIPDAKDSYSIMLFPNMSEQVVFVSPDQEIQIEANATQLKDIKITGGNANKLMSAFRAETKDASPDQFKETAIKYIMANPASITSIYLLKKYLINVDSPDIDQIQKAVGAIAEAQPLLASIKNLSDDIQAYSNLGNGKKAPDFNVTDYQGKKHQLSDYKDKKLIIMFGASWAEVYREEIRNIKSDVEGMQEKPEILNVVLDLTRPLFRTILRDSIPGANISELRGWESDIVKSYQIKKLPTYFLIDKNQQIVAREDSWNNIKEKIK